MTKKQSEPTTNTLNIYQKLQKVQAQVGQLKKTEENKFQKYFYVDEYAILMALKPLLEQQQLTLTFDDTEEPIKVEEQTTAKGGKEWVVQYRKRAILTNTEQPEQQITFNFWAMGQNTDIAKAKGSAETYAVKYFLQKFFLIPSSENDPDERDDGSPTQDNKEEESLLTKKPQKTEFIPQATVTITNIKPKLDKNNNQYLLLETDTLANNVFVFPYKVADSRWPELIKDKTYQFNLEESENGLLVLLDFSEIK